MKILFSLFLFLGIVSLTGCFHPNSVYGYLEKYPVEKDGKVVNYYHYHSTQSGWQYWNTHYPCPERIDPDKFMTNIVETHHIYTYEKIATTATNR